MENYQNKMTVHTQTIWEINRLLRNSNCFNSFFLGDKKQNIYF